LAGTLEVYFSQLKTSGGLIEREQALVLDQSVDVFVTLGNAFSHQVRSMELECLPKLQSLEARLQEFLGDRSSARGGSDSSFPPHAEVSQTAPAQIQEVIVERLSDSTGAINSGGGTGQVVHVTPDANTVHRIVVLLIDDQRIIGESLRQMLQNESDIQFHFCQDPMKAIEIALEIRPTVILQDLVMPELDGLELVRRFRAQQDLDKVPLIVLSGTEVAEVKAEAFALGANDYMVKLPNALEVIARIRYHSQGYINLLEREAAMARVTWLAEHDPLTACLNRRTWHEGLDEAIVTLALDEALLLAICDIDLFKKVNDTYGHQCGDDAIQHVVAILEKGIGGLGQLGRLGGEEFGIFMVLSKITSEAGDPVMEADKIFEHIRKELENSPLNWNEHVLTLTMSFGITFHRAGENGESALSRADAGVYQAKDGGRNQVARM
jgi:two-component system chemotaxis family response regulator WspR